VRLVYPSVKKVGIGIGVSYGRGVLVCRTGDNMDDKWGAPMIYTLDTSSMGAPTGFHFHGLKSEIPCLSQDVA
jgi:lipid-binding SYLF domain-containing protein